MPPREMPPRKMLPGKNTSWKECLLHILWAGKMPLKEKKLTILQKKIVFTTNNGTFKNCIRQCNNVNEKTSHGIKCVLIMSNLNPEYTIQN